ncbi:MAG: DUF488 domain-containing protein [Burkholderiaceae bacterium]
MDIQIKRAYEPAAADDGQRILVDRLWPRGISKEHAHLDLWAKEISPSTELREAFHHDPGRLADFVRAYHAELDANPSAVAQLTALARKGRLTLIYGAKDEVDNNAAVLRDYLLAHHHRAAPPTP